MKNNTKYVIALVGVLSLIILGSLALSDSSQDNTKLVNNEMPLYSKSSATIPALNHTELNNCSDTIVIGTVQEILPSKWNTADGKRPSNTDDAFSPFCLIYTDVVISVDKYLKNPLSSKEVTVRVEGGTAGHDTLIADYEPTFQPGEKILLYLIKDFGPGTKNIDPEHFRVTGYKQGKFTLTNDGKAIGFDRESISQEELLSTIKE
ncbi:hypothetical protein MSHOH_1058 [Methanosarcina horonobensis HB-1 = JCM 15518]|uniref:Uncharacterized protein n=1 Tax=Methanosarcina horonobensis HB-1 = JCM 15518 TaxID=1434110 RepID=A0A0E3S9W9_9EURY|nr:hypothetical protein [Methanosarcina horonobensis]AKB77541.1 hypothetical protein MSHOH_1058 [Methanosarcina horonobensis HB-1 = JCM 15518]